MGYAKMTDSPASSTLSDLSATFAGYAVQIELSLKDAFIASGMTTTNAVAAAKDAARGFGVIGGGLAILAAENEAAANGGSEGQILKAGARALAGSLGAYVASGFVMGAVSITAAATLPEIAVTLAVVGLVSYGGMALAEGMFDLGALGVDALSNINWDS